MAAGSDRLVSDAEREAVANALGRHLAAGHLSMAEYRARLDAVYAAATAAELAQVTAGLPAGGPGAPGAGAGPVFDAGLSSLMSNGRRVLGRILGAGALLAAATVTGVILVIAALAGHGSLLVAGLILLFAPAALLAVAGGALVWAGRRAWRSGVWLDGAAAAAGMPGVGPAARGLRLLALSRVLVRLGALVGRPLRWRGFRRQGRVTGSGRPGRPGKATAWFQDEPGGQWHQARVRSRTNR